MSERQIAADPSGPWSVSLVFDDLTPMSCIGVHVINGSGKRIFVVTANALLLSVFQPGTDTVVPLIRSIAVSTVKLIRGDFGWVVPGLTDKPVRFSQGTT